MNQIDASIILSTRSRSEILKRTLSTFAALDTGDLRWEVIVVDNGSDDDTPSVLEECRRSLPLTVLNEPRPGKNRALNRALRVAKGRLLVFTDDDVLADRAWLPELVAAADRWPEDSVFSGRIDLCLPESTPPWIRQLSRSFKNILFSAHEPTDTEGPVSSSPTGPSLMIRRRVFDDYEYEESIGPAGSQYAMGSESELLLRLHDAGYRFIHVPTARVQHIIRPEQVNLSWLLGRAHRAGRGGRRLGGTGGPLSGVRVFGLKWTGIARLLIFAGPYWLTRPLPDRFRFKPGWNYHLALGQIHEDRMLRREKKRGSKA